MEIDVHGLTFLQALEAFLDTYNAQVNKGSYESISVVHGYGSTGEGGKIQSRLRSYLQQYAPDQFTYRPGEEIDGNPGYTLVVPRLPLPSFQEVLSDEIVDYCQTPKTHNKVTGKFRDYGAPNIKKALDWLLGNKRLIVVWKGKHKLYQVAME